RFAFRRDRILDESLRDVDPDDARPTIREQSRVVTLAATDVEHGKARDIRKHLEERGRIDEVAVDVVPSARELRPYVGVAVPVLAYFAMVHDCFMASTPSESRRPSASPSARTRPHSGVPRRR